MAVQTKICGLKTPETVAAAVDGGAALVGFVFYPKSPRAVTPQQAAVLGRFVPAGIERVGLFVDEDDRTVRDTVATAKLTMVQLHGAETPDRVRAIRAVLQVPVIKAVGIAAREDLGKIPPYEAVADYLMFDAKPNPGKDDALPGGNARSFDWSMLTGRASAGPWFLAGGLTPENLAEAVAATGAAMVDVSSGVEEKRGVKDTGKIRAFLDAARAL